MITEGQFFLFIPENIPHLNHLDETVQMCGHNICFYAELTKNIPNYHQILPDLELCGTEIL